VKNIPLHLVPRGQEWWSYWVFRAQADSAFILPSELPAKELHHLPRKVPPQAYQTSQYAAAFFSASGAALSQGVLTVK
jgi:hypothetical protein